MQVSFAYVYTVQTGNRRVQELRRTSNHLQPSQRHLHQGRSRIPNTILSLIIENKFENGLFDKNKERASIEVEEVQTLTMSS